MPKVSCRWYEGREAFTASAIGWLGTARSICPEANPTAFNAAAAWTGTWRAGPCQCAACAAVHAAIARTGTAASAVVRAVSGPIAVPGARLDAPPGAGARWRAWLSSCLPARTSVVATVSHVSTPAGKKGIIRYVRLLTVLVLAATLAAGMSANVTTAATLSRRVSAASDAVRRDRSIQRAMIRTTAKRTTVKSPKPADLLQTRPRYPSEFSGFHQ